MKDYRQRARISVRGAVQGVGFRPFVFRLATSLDLAGWVNNSSHGVWIEVEGRQDVLRQFVDRLGGERPPRSFIQSLEVSYLDPVGYSGFEIRASTSGEATTALVLPDVATCPDCLAEVLHPADRRHRYPFTNCTNCGPRFSIIEALPYDRPNTTMRRFAMCEACRSEYEDPRDRRFHAQPNACPVCGPRLELWMPDGSVVAAGDEALRQAADEVRRGHVLAAKGLGGFHLVVDAGSGGAVAELRRRKTREEKPFALMAPSLAQVRDIAEVSDMEARLLSSPEAPIVLLKARSEAARAIAASVAPGNPYLGVMLPYTPLHHLLLAEIGGPVVATSGNRADEPICTDEREALSRLAGLADVFLVHDRPIARHVDDSVARVLLERELVLRRARGYAPLPVRVAVPAAPMVAVGAHLKNTVAVTSGDNVFVSQHIGDLETPEALAAFREALSSLSGLYRVTPEVIACDEHPAYSSTVFARESGLPVVSVQHHYAHILAAMAENELVPPVLGVSWDGTGFGLDGTVWGGEFLSIDEPGFTRVAHLRTFGLPGGDKAVKEPRRAALGLLYELEGVLDGMAGLAPIDAFSAAELRVLERMLERGVNAPRTSSAGRLFDAVASLVGLRQVVRFEGQAAMELEFLLAGIETDDAYPSRLNLMAGLRSGPKAQAATASASAASGSATTSAASVAMSVTATAANSAGAATERPEARRPYVVDWGPAVRAILEDVRCRVAPALVSARFHNTLVQMILDVARQAGHERVVLSGGCFQNAYLLERTVQRLERDGFRPYWHQRVPPNDGGIALGQVIGALRALKEGGRR